jgi:hypothetical protein
MFNDQSRVADRIGREGGHVPLGHGGTEPLGGFADEKREGRILLNPAEMFYRVPAPSAGMKAV